MRTPVRPASTSVAKKALQKARPDDLTCSYRKYVIPEASENPEQAHAEAISFSHSTLRRRRNTDQKVLASPERHGGHALVHKV